MSKLGISISNDYFIKDGKPFFYLADTAWMAFAKAKPEEWKEYLDYRKTQGYNALQIMVIPCIMINESDIPPFMTDSHGKWDFSRMNEEYFTRAYEMARMAYDHGFLLSLAPLWVDYVKDSWANTPDFCMPLDCVKPYLEYVFEKFSPLDPIYMISGDTAFETADIYEYYRVGLKTLKESYPTSLSTMHLGTYTDLPEEFAESVDFYMYQSSHEMNGQHLCSGWAEIYRAKTVKRPIVAGEPCYEGHSRVPDYKGASHIAEFSRFNSHDVRAAFWHSILAGAKAGFAYGAHGIINWHEKNEIYKLEGSQNKPFDWKAAMKLEGSWDVAYGKFLFEIYSMFDLEPSRAIVNNPDQIKMAVSKDGRKIVIYSPYASDIIVDMDLKGYDFIVMDMKTRNCIQPSVVVSENRSTIVMNDFNSDYLVIGTK